jgi:hypothetical protein
MKTSNIILSVLLVGILFSCDKVDRPVVPDDTEKLIQKFYPEDPANFELNPTFPENTNTNRNVLIEDYTGHTCNNCPPAATIAKNIETTYSGRAFVLSVHAGGATNSFQRVSADYPTDFTTEAGTAYSVDIPNFFGNPSGLISRKIYNTKLWLVSGDWDAATQAVLNENKLVANIQIISKYYPETGGVFVHYEVEAKEDISDDLRVIILLAEKKVISPQKMPDGSKTSDYEHHNVLSGILTSTYLAEDGSINYSSFFGNNIGSLKSGEKKTGLAINGLKEMNTKRTINADGGNDLVVFALVTNSSTNEIYQVVTQDLEF